MAKAMDTHKQTKNERRRAAAEAREAARRKQAQRRTLGWALGGAALIAVVVIAVFALMGEEGGSGDSPPVTPSLSGTVTTDGAPRSEPLAAGEAVPDFSAPGVGGGTVRWSDVAGGPVVLSVWAPWCPHCQVELPLLDEVMKGFTDVGFMTIVTSIDDSPGPDAGEFLAENGITAPTAIDDVDGTLARAFGIQAFPTLYFIASDGTVVQEMEGEVDEATLIQVIGSLT